MMQKMEMNQFFREFIQQYDSHIKQSLQRGYRYLPKKKSQIQQ